MAAHSTENKNTVNEEPLILFTCNLKLTKSFLRNKKRTVYSPPAFRVLKVIPCNTKKMAIFKNGYKICTKTKLLLAYHEPQKHKDADIKNTVRRITEYLRIDRLANQDVNVRNKRGHASEKEETQKAFWQNSSITTCGLL